MQSVARERMPGRTATIISATLGLLWGGALGVPGGDHIRHGGQGGGEAVMFYLEAFLLLCLLLFLPRFSRKAGWIVIAATAGYAIGLVAGHMAGYFAGNFVGWHPD